MIVMIIESDFAPRDHTRMARQLVHLGVVGIRRVLRLMRMDPHRRIDPVVLLGVGNRGPKFLDFGSIPDRQQCRNSRRACAIEHRLAVVLKVRDIDVRM